MNFKKENADSERDKIKIIESTNIPVIEEFVTIDKEKVETGKVSVRKTIHKEHVSVDMPLLSQNVKIERVSINKYVDSPPEIRNEGNTTVIPILKEVVEKRLVLVEEVRVTKENVQTNSQENIILRKEEVNIERVKVNTGKPENFK